MGYLPHRSKINKDMLIEYDSYGTGFIYTFVSGITQKELEKTTKLKKLDIVDNINIKDLFFCRNTLKELVVYDHYQLHCRLGTIIEDWLTIQDEVHITFIDPRLSI